MTTTVRPKFLMICVNRRFRADEASCAARSSVEMAGAIEAGVVERRIDIKVERSVCMGQCMNGPTLRLAPGGKFILGKSPSDVAEILDELEQTCGVLDETETPLHLLGS